MGIVNACGKIGDRSDPNINVVVVGDGRTPRTAALISVMSRWNVTSIGPNLK